MAGTCFPGSSLVPGTEQTGPGGFTVPRGLSAAMEACVIWQTEGTAGPGALSLREAPPPPHTHFCYLILLWFLFSPDTPWESTEMLMRLSQTLGPRGHVVGVRLGQAAGAVWDGDCPGLKEPGGGRTRSREGGKARLRPGHLSTLKHTLG